MIKISSTLAREAVMFVSVSFKSHKCGTPGRVIAMMKISQVFDLQKKSITLRLFSIRWVLAAASGERPDQTISEASYDGKAFSRAAKVYSFSDSGKRFTKKIGISLEKKCFGRLHATNVTLFVAFLKVGWGRSGYLCGVKKA